MNSYSISFTLGKASVAHGANLDHNNRKFTAANIDAKRSGENITYTRQDVRDAYQQLFGKAVEEYNAKQSRPCRRIKDYYEHIASGNREEAFYEIVVQFGDSKTSPCGSNRGEIAKQMLDEYMKNFQSRNPNLHVFNAVLHMDEASPHLHINFIPFYTELRERYLSTGVSMKAALDEQGFRAKGQKENRLVAWEESERQEMEKLLHRHGFVREDKNAKYAHQTVEDFKRTQDVKKMMEALRAARNVTPDETKVDNVRKLKERLQEMEKKTKSLERERQSPYKSFFYSAPDKQAWIQAKLEELNIPYRETENGFEAQECYVQVIRRLEKEYKAPRSAARDQLRDDIDRMLMQSKSFDELLAKLEQAHYTIKRGKYIAVKPEHGSNYIRLKSLGEFYSEYALRNRITAKQKYEQQLAQKIEEAKKRNAPNVIVLRTMQFYTISFASGALPVRKHDQKKPFAWTNDAELDRLLALNKKINEGATIETLRDNFSEIEKNVSDKIDALEKAKADFRMFCELKEKIEIVFEGKTSAIFSQQQAEQTLRQYPQINAANYRNVDQLIANEEQHVLQASADLETEQKRLHEIADMLEIAEKVMGGTYVQSLVGAERERREANYVPNGLKMPEVQYEKK